MTQRLKILTIGAQVIADYLRRHQVSETTCLDVYDEAIQTLDQDPGFDIVIIDAVHGDQNAMPLLQAIKQYLPRTRIPSVYVRHDSESCFVSTPDGTKRKWRLQPSLRAYYPFATFHKIEADETPWLCSIIVDALPPVTDSFH